jgi:hypothetical protein
MIAVVHQLLRIGPDARSLRAVVSELGPVPEVWGLQHRFDHELMSAVIETIRRMAFLSLGWARYTHSCIVRMWSSKQHIDSRRCRIRRAAHSHLLRVDYAFASPALRPPQETTAAGRRDVPIR